MTFKTSKLAQLVVAYDAHFRKQVPIEALRILQPVDLVALIQKAIDTNTALAETVWAGPRLSSSAARGRNWSTGTPANRSHKTAPTAS